MVLERKLMKMVQVIWEYSRMEREMVKEHTLTLMETSMKGNRRMGNIMVKEHSLSRMEALSRMGKNMKGSGRMETLGMGYYTTKRETSYTKL